MKLTKVTLLLLCAVIQSAAYANTAPPSGEYKLVAVRCNDSQTLRYAEPVTFRKFSNMMIQANVPGRDSLKPYYFSFEMEKSNDALILHWHQLHTGNATDDARNHTPFYSSFTTQGRLSNNNLTDMHLVPETTNIIYLEKIFNKQKFSAEDITGRMAKTKHLGKYSTKIRWSAITDTKLKNKILYEFTELDHGFGAPRHLLCGAVDAKISYIVTPK